MTGIRADGNNQIGIGHVMRCLTIADALKEIGEDVIFFTADHSCEEMITERGFACRVLETPFDDMESEPELLQTVMEKAKVDRLLIDSYYVTEEYLNRLRECVATIYLDDVDSFPYLVDLLVNYNVFAKALDYPYGVEYTENAKRSSVVKEDITQVLAGPKYAPVRKEFAECRAGINDNVSEILITLGGSDAHNLSYKISKALLKATDACLNVVCGPFNLHKQALYELSANEPRMTVYENVKDMWNLMGKCDLAVSAAGSTMCELAVEGVPTVTFSFVENQRRIAETFGEKEAAVSVGHYETKEEDIFLQSLADEVKSLMASRDKRENLVRNASEIVDGLGAMRIARAIAECK